MGMYTELYLAVDFKKSTPLELIEKIKFNQDEFQYIGFSSVYFKGLSLCEFEEKDGQFKMTIKFDIKNYEGQIEAVLKAIEPYIDGYGHIGHKRYKENDMPTLLFYDGKKIVEDELPNE